MEILIVSPSIHRGEKRVLLRYAKRADSAVDRVTRELAGRAYSSTRKVWHIPWREDYREYITEVFGKLAEVEIRFEEPDASFPEKKAVDQPQQPLPEKKVTIKIDQSKKRFKPTSRGILLRSLPHNTGLRAMTPGPFRILQIW